MKSTLLRIALVAGLVGAASSFAIAQDAPASQDTPQDREQAHGRRLGRMGKGLRGMHRGPRRGLRALGQLDLTDAQREQLRALRQKHHEANREKGLELRELMRQRRQGGELSAEQQARARELVAALRESRERQRAEALNTLTPEQRTRLERLRSEHKQRREEFRQRREEFRQRRPQQTPPGNML